MPRIIQNPGRCRYSVLESPASTNTLDPPGFVGTIAGGTIPLAQWACLEYRVSMNTPGLPDGVITAWIDGAEVVSRNDLLLRGATDNVEGNTPTSNMALIQTYRQHGHGIAGGTTGYIYYDDYAASRDAQIGCGDMPSDTIAPAQPTGLSII